MGTQCYCTTCKGQNGNYLLPPCAELLALRHQQDLKPTHTGRYAAVEHTASCLHIWTWHVICVACGQQVNNFSRAQGIPCVAQEKWRRGEVVKRLHTLSTWLGGRSHKVNSKRTNLLTPCSTSSDIVQRKRPTRRGRHTSAISSRAPRKYHQKHNIPQRK